MPEHSTLHWTVIPWVLGALSALAFLAILSLAQYVYNRQIQLTSFQSQAQQLHNSFIGQIESTLRTVKNAPPISAQCTKEDLHTLRQLQFDNTNIALFGLIGPDGRVLCTSWGTPTQTYMVKQPMLKPGEVEISGPLKLRYISRPSFLMVWGTDEEHALYGWVPIYQLQQAFLQLDPKIHVEIFNTQTQSSLLALGAPESYITIEKRPGLGEIKQPTLTDIHATGHQLYYYVAPIQGLSHITLYLSYDLANPLVPLSFEPLWFLIASILFFIVALSSQQLRRNMSDSRWSLRRALAHNQLKSYFQPIFNTHTQRIVGLELLVRWQHPRQGLLTPDHFMANLFRYRLGTPLLLKQLSELPSLLEPIKQHHPELRINLNIQGQQLLEPLVLKALKNLQKHLGSLTIELKEHELFSKNPQFINALEQLRRQEIKIAIDDFGTGFSSLVFLQQFPIDLLKIDPMFIASIGTDAVSAPVLESIIHLGHRLHLQMIAEGVETIEQSEKLDEWGIVNQQGWLHGEAQPLNRLLSQLESNRPSSEETA